MDGAVIRKSPAERARANLDNYAWAHHDFRWARARSWLSGLPDDRGLNIGYEAVDRHARSARRDRLALGFRSSDGALSALTCRELAQATNRFANLLAALGVRAGERVFVFAGAGPEAYVAALGTLKYGAVLTTLPVSRATEAAHCLSASEAAVLVTSPALYEQRLAPIRPHLPGLRQVLLAAGGAADGRTGLDAALEGMSPRFTVPPTDPRQPALVHFTTGRAGTVSGVVHTHGSVVSHLASAIYALDLHDDDVLQVTVEPGRTTHTAYGIIAPLVHGVATMVDLSGSNLPVADRDVSVWYAPSADLEHLAAATPLLRLPKSLRLIVAEGGHLRPETVVRSHNRWGLAVHDTWWQTETGGILLANYAGLDILPGSVGLPLPGIRAALVTRAGPGQVTVLDAADEVGELAIRTGWPSMFLGYLHDPGRTAGRFTDGWYLTGDLARRDAGGRYWIVGRRPSPP
ncbi:MAG: AMP-binding protein [Actinomycetota bacterium]|nr:AMP-binding protein [Actinomycetota bacterium]